MKSIRKYMLILVLGVCSFRSSGQEGTGVPDTVPEGFRKAWSVFAEAAIAGDRQKMIAGSASCIRCVNCLDNTPAEDSAAAKFIDKHPQTWYSKKYGKLCYIPIAQFITEDLPLILEPETKNRLIDNTKLIYIEDAVNKRLYEKGCIIRRRERSNAECYEVLVTAIDSAYPREGLQKAFAFIKVGSKYMFCGYSTIP